ncbi:MAG TPA: DUF2779 domain-containing protein [Candidatus Paceibacterota bacterium]|nr:DUF2779 domain-containing protein [Candidatus Paceibacterota bacterium]
MKLTKTDYLIYKDCAKNAWVKVYKPEIYFAKPLSPFDEGIIETGNEVDLLARDLFPDGVIPANRDASEETMEFIKAQTPVIYQPVFETEFYKAICDILVWDPLAKVYDLYEVKASNSGENKKAKDELYTSDIAFQYLVLKELGVPIGKLNLVRLNNEYVREASLDIRQLFSIEDFTERVMDAVDIVKEDMKNAYDILSNEVEPFGPCKCIVRGRSAHCTTFSYSNPHIPEYSVHDISRIGSSKAKLAELIDSEIFTIEDVPEDFPLSEKQRNQVMATQLNKVIIDKEEISDFLDKISTPISFLDYETFAAGIPRFTGYSPFNQIPFQFSLHVVDDPEREPSHFEFIFTANRNPDEDFILALKEYLPSTGHVIVWNKSFEMGRNKDLALRNPEHKAFLEDVNSRMIDLMDIFTNQHFIHPKFKGKTSIKYILPVLAPDLSYKTLDIKEGATASNTWNEIVVGELTDEEKEEKTKHLLTYCKLDTYAMYRIWKYLRELN